MAIFHCNGTVSALDAAFNIGYGSILPLLFLISLILNPIIFIYNYKQRASVGSLLFQLLAVSDFMTCLYQPLVLSSALLSSRAGSMSRKPNNLRIASTVVIAAVIFGSGMLTNLLSITRYIKIKYTFFKVNRKAVIVFAICNFILFDGAIITLLLSSSTQYFDERIQMVWYDLDYWSIILIALFGVQSLLATFTSIATVHELRKGVRARDRSIKQVRSKTKTEKMKRRVATQKRSGFTVLLMSAGNMLLVVFGIIYIVIKAGNFDGNTCPQKKLYDITVFNLFGFIPIFLSAINPLVVTFRSSGVKAMLLGQQRPSTAGDGTGNQGDTTGNGRLSSTVPRIINRQYLRSASAPPERRSGRNSLFVIQNFSALIRSVSSASVAPEPEESLPVNSQINSQINRSVSCSYPG